MIERNYVDWLIDLSYDKEKCITNIKNLRKRTVGLNRRSSRGAIKKEVWFLT